MYILLSISQHWHGWCPGARSVPGHLLSQCWSRPYLALQSRLDGQLIYFNALVNPFGHLGEVSAGINMPWCPQLPLFKSPKSTESISLLRTNAVLTLNLTRLGFQCMDRSENFYLRRSRQVYGSSESRCCCCCRCPEKVKNLDVSSVFSEAARAPCSVRRPEQGLITNPTPPAWDLTLLHYGQYIPPQVYAEILSLFFDN